MFFGVYDTLDIFAFELEKWLKERGYEICRCNIKSMAESLGNMARFLEKPVKAAITFNNLGFNMEINKGKNIWDELGVPCINILVDHPFCYHSALVNAPQKSVVLLCDRNHMKYVQRFYPDIPITGYLPHAGISVSGQSGEPIAKRKGCVMYAGGLSRKFAENIIPDLSKYTEFDANKICTTVYNKVIANPDMTTECAIEETLAENGAVYDDDRLREIIADLHFIDLHIVSHYREKVVRSVAEGGIELDLYGRGWDICECIELPNVHYHGTIPASEVVEKMQDFKVVLSTMTWFKDGTHDRIFNGMLQGAVAVSDESGYIREEFDDSEMVIFKLTDIDYAVNKIKWILENPDKAQSIADKGYEKAMQRHTWRCRAKELDEDLLSEL